MAQELSIPDIPRNLDPYLTRYFQVMRIIILSLQERVKVLEDEHGI